MKLQYIEYENIDQQKWDACIAGCINGNIYAQSYYLNAMAGRWDALVSGDYEIVMPVTYRKKYFIKYLYQPAFTQQLGIFFKTPPPGEVYHAFMSVLKKKFRYAGIMFNHLNLGMPGIETGKICSNFIVDLRPAYPKIHAGYKSGFLKNLRRCEKFGFKYSEAADTKMVIDMYYKLYAERSSGAGKKDYVSFKKICDRLQTEGCVYGRKVLDSNGNLAAAVVLLQHGNRLYNFISCITKKGRDEEANYFLYDRLISEFSCKGWLLDLEGSDIKGIAHFYQSMGAVDEPYPFIRYNDLPLVIKLFKK